MKTVCRKTVVSCITQNYVQFARRRGGGGGGAEGFGGVGEGRRGLVETMSLCEMGSQLKLLGVGGYGGDLGGSHGG